MKHFVARYHQEAVALLETLAQIPSPSNKEEKRTAFLSSYLRSKGGEPTVDDVGNVLCRVGHNGGDVVVFAAHIDIVENSTEPLPLKKNGNIWTCPGIGDDTANVVNLMMAFLYAKEHEQKLKTDLLFVADTGEEALGNLRGVRKLFADYASSIKAFYSLDFHYPYVYPIPVGSHRFLVTVTTKGGHSYTDFGSPNAIVEASRLIEKLSEIPVSEDPKTTWNLGTIQGGTTVNSIASSCSFRYEYRSTSEEEIQRMKKAFSLVLEGSQKEGVSIQVENIGERPAMGQMDMAALNAFTKKTEEAVQAATGMEPILTSLSSDSNIPLSMGILANTVGTIVGDGAHTKEEWIDISSLPQGMEIAVRLVSLYFV